MTKKINQRQLREMVEGAIRQVIKEEYCSMDCVMSAYEKMKDAMGAEALCDAIAKALPIDSLKSTLEDIDRNYETHAFEDGYCDDDECYAEDGYDEDSLDEGRIMNSIKKALGKAKEYGKKVGKKIEDYADDQWEEPVDKRIGSVSKGVNSGKPA